MFHHFCQAKERRESGVCACVYLCIGACLLVLHAEYYYLLKDIHPPTSSPSQGTHASFSNQLKHTHFWTAEGRTCKPHSLIGWDSNWLFFAVRQHRATISPWLRTSHCNSQFQKDPSVCFHSITPAPLCFIPPSSSHLSHQQRSTF